MSKNKNTKLFLAGTMAVSAVVTAGAPVFADTEPAVPNVEDAAAKLAEQYFNLTEDQRKMLDIVQKNVAENLDLFINSDYENAEQLATDLAPLLKPVTGTTKEAVAEDAVKRVNDFREAAEDYLTEDVSVDEVLQMASAVRNDLLEDIKTADPNNLEPLIRKAIESFNANAPADLKEIVNIPSAEDAADLLDKIQEEIDAVLDGGVTPMPTPTPTDGVLTVTKTTVEDNPQIVLRAIEAASSLNEIVVTTNSEPAEVTVPFTIVNALAKKNADALLTVQSQTGSISVPVGTFDATEIADELDVTTPELVMQFSIAEQTQATSATDLNIAASYNVSVGTTERLVPVSNFGYPVERTIQTPTAMDAATTVGLHVFDDGTTRAVPTYVVDGDTVKMNFSELEAHRLVSYSKSFADVNKIDGGNYWGKPYIDKLASRMIVSGKTENSFSPSTTITRGEFAAILSRGLGLRPADFHGESAAAFTDVSLDQAVNSNGEIYAVYEAGIIAGYGNKKFGPYDPITRSEAAIMISNAMDFIGEQVEMDGDKKVSQFGDYRYISGQARPHVERVYQAGYISGFKDDTYRPANNATRAEMSRILYNFLESIEFIN